MTDKSEKSQLRSKLDKQVDPYLFEFYEANAEDTRPVYWHNEGYMLFSSSLYNELDNIFAMMEFVSFDHTQLVKMEANLLVKWEIPDSNDLEEWKYLVDLLYPLYYEHFIKVYPHISRTFMLSIIKRFLEWSLI